MILIHPDILAALAHERVSTFLDEADVARQARLARASRLRRSHARVRGKPVLLSDGSKVVIRPVQSADAPLLADGFARLSSHSRRMRFLTTKKELSPAELRYFSDVDHHDHEALGALVRADGRGVGVARYVRDGGDPWSAEIAITVIDDWQGLGLGTALLGRLARRARQEGICRFTALVSADNAAVAGLIGKFGAVAVGRGRGTVQYELTLARRKDALAGPVSRERVPLG